VDIAPLSAQIGHVTEANGELQIANERLKVANSSLLAENEQLKSVLRADADAGLAANTKGWLPFEKYVWGHQIVLLPVTPDADTTAKWTEASMLYEKGGESAMLGVVNTLTQQAGVLNSELGKLKQSVEVAQSERDAAQTKADEAFQKAKDATASLEAAVAKAKSDEASRLAAETRAWQVKVANWFGAGAGMLAAGLLVASFFFAVASGMLREGAAICFVLCLGGFATARFAAWQYFEATIVATFVVFSAAWGSWKFHQSIKRKDAAEKAAKTAAVVPYATTLVDIINEADKKATTDQKKTLDELIFDPMKDADKIGQFDVMRHDLETQRAKTVAETKASIALEKTFKGDSTNGKENS
jgi:hypothetical protein